MLGHKILPRGWYPGVIVYETQGAAEHGHTEESEPYEYHTGPPHGDLIEC